MWKFLRGSIGALQLYSTSSLYFFAVHGDILYNFFVFYSYRVLNVILRKSMGFRNFVYSRFHYLDNIRISSNFISLVKRGQFERFFNRVSFLWYRIHCSFFRFSLVQSFSWFIFLKRGIRGGIETELKFSRFKDYLSTLFRFYVNYSKVHSFYFYFYLVCYVRHIGCRYQRINFSSIRGAF